MTDDAMRRLMEETLRRELIEDAARARKRYAAGELRGATPLPAYDETRAAGLAALGHVEQIDDATWLSIEPPGAEGFLGIRGEAIARLAPGVWWSGQRQLRFRDALAMQEARGAV